ncbi:aldo/keto reductase [Rhodopirellula sp. JC740]|uniref:Aldo/keto reductase n=1 Tax=Rhodopirellula halodulae TaxID=2894198 RepID=A0ABS8NMZ5_9BACT|nr:aldo/keto reductase [Rhodopirellula sp. JC740]MCC9644943.1 aldo/keto reductase [Rhodopirellula sp. JC740]
MNQHVILGLWPIAGVTTVGVTRENAIATIHAAVDAGIRQFDTAYSYGLQGEADERLGAVLRELDPGLREEMHLIGKVGQRYDENGVRVNDGRPETLVLDAENSLRRIGIRCFDTLMLHCVDEEVPVEASAWALQRLVQRGMAKRVGLCNATEEQRAAFATVVPCEAIQCPLNGLQQDTLQTVIADAKDNQCDVWVYWTLMKGLLAGKISRDHVFAEGDSRPSYPIFQGEARQRAHDIVDQLTVLAADHKRSVANLSISWAVSQPGVTAALVGAHRPEQIADFANAGPLPKPLRREVNRIFATSNESVAE